MTDPWNKPLTINFLSLAIGPVSMLVHATASARVETAVLALAVIVFGCLWVWSVVLGVKETTLNGLGSRGMFFWLLSLFEFVNALALGDYYVDLINRNSVN